MAREDLPKLMRLYGVLKMDDHGEKGELISVTDAAKRLGVHRNTIDGRCAKGIYVWEWAEGPKGRQKFIHVASLENTEPVTNGQPVNPLPALPVSAQPDVVTQLLTQLIKELDPILAESQASAARNTHLLEQLRNAARGNVQMIREMREVAKTNGQLEERCAHLTLEVERLKAELVRVRRLVLAPDN